MKQIKVDCTQPPMSIPLGKQGENLVTQVLLDCSYFVSTFGDGIAQLMHKQAQSDVLYPVDIEQDGSIVKWTVTNADTGCVGTGKAELRWYVDNALAKSVIFHTDISKTLDGNENPTPPVSAKSWVDHVVDSAIKSITSSTKAEQSAAYAKRDAASAANNAKAAILSADLAEQSVETVKLSETNAAQSEKNAKVSETNIKVSEANAFRYANDADSSKTGAEVAANKAIQSETVANQAKTDAEAARDAAQLAAQDVAAIMKTHNDSSNAHSGLFEMKADKSGWIPDKFIGTDPQGNLIVKDCPSGDISNSPWTMLVDDTTTVAASEIRYTNEKYPGISGTVEIAGFVDFSNIPEETLIKTNFNVNLGYALVGAKYFYKATADEKRMIFYATARSGYWKQETIADNASPTAGVLLNPAQRINMRFLLSGRSDAFGFKYRNPLDLTVRAINWEFPAGIKINIWGRQL